MVIGQTNDFLKGYDEDAEVKVEARFGEARESYVSSFDVTFFSPEEGKGKIGVFTLWSAST